LIPPSPIQTGENTMSKYRPDALSLFYFKDRHEADAVFNSLVAVDDAIKEAKDTRQARAKLRELLQSPSQIEQTRQFIERIIELSKDRMERYAQAALRRVFTSTHHYQSGMKNRTDKARKENSTP
jgi:hypothetical protein